MDYRSHSINSHQDDADAPLISDTDQLHDDWDSYQRSKDIPRSREQKKPCLKRPLSIAALVVSSILVLCLLLGVILSFTVAPGMVRNVVKDSHLVINSLSLSSPGAAEVSVSLKGYFDKSSPLPAKLASASFTLSYDGNDVGSLVLPEINFKTQGAPSGKTPVSVSAKLSITSISAFSSFSKAMIEKDTIDFRLYGKSSVKVPLLFGLNVKVDIDKTVTITGLDGLKSLKLANLSFSKSNSQHVILDADVQIVNPSVVSIDPIGSLSLAVWYKGAFMGLAITADTKISVGMNSIPASAIIDPTDLNLASDLISDFLSSRQLDLTVIGSGNVSSIPLYSTALSGLTVNTSFIQSPPVQLIPQIDVLAMDLVPLDNLTCSMSVIMRASINNPLGPNCPLQIGQTIVNTSLTFQDYSTGHFSANTTILSQSATRMTVSATAIFFIDRDVIVPGTGRTAFSLLLETLEHAPSVTVSFSGFADIDAHVDALGYLSLKRLIVQTSTSIAGLDGLKTATLTAVNVPANAPGPAGSGLLMQGNGTVGNPSVLSMNLGDVDMDMFANGTFMGRVTCKNFTMVPGMNFISVNGILKPDNLTVAAGFFHNYITGANSTVIINGTLPNSPYPKQTSMSIASSKWDQEASDQANRRSMAELDSRLDIDWLNEAITSLSVEAVVPGMVNYKAIRDMIVVDLAMDFTQSQTTPTANGTMLAYYNFPFDFPFTFQDATIRVDMGFNGTDIAHMELPWMPIETFPTEKAFQVSVTGLDVHVTNAPQFSMFLLELFLTMHTTATLKGDGDANVETNMGIVPMRSIPFDNVLQLNGTNRFQTPPVSVKNLNLVGGENGLAFITLDLNITNPSSATLFIGRLVLSLVYNGIYVGNGTIENMLFYKGLNSYTVQGVFIQLPSNLEASREFLSQFIQGHSLDVSLEGTPWSTNITLLKPALSALVAPATLPGFSQKLITYAQLIFDLGRLLMGQIPARLTVYNPFDADIFITAVNVNVVYKDQIIALIDTNLESDPIRAQNRSFSVTRTMYGKIEGVSIDFFRTLTGTIKVTVNGTMDVLVGSGFRATLDYVQHNISAGFNEPPPNGHTLLADFEEALYEEEETQNDKV